MKRQVIFSHQSTLAHYRIDLYNEIQRLKPDWLDFEVLIDESGVARRLYFKDKPNLNEVKFKLKKTKTYLINKRYPILIQSFLKDISDYDLAILQHALHNLSYPISSFTARDTKIAYWGHGRDILDGDSNFFKRSMEAFKLALVKRANGYFAYTEGVKRYLSCKGIETDKIFTINNTIDIELNRKIFNQLTPGINRNWKNLVYIGRLQERKRIDYLLEVFEEIYAIDNDFTLHLVGGGDVEFVNKIKNKAKRVNIEYYGVVTDPQELGKIFCRCQYLVFPGDVGLGPLQALCYNVIPIVIDGATHGPEYEYLNEQNSYIMNSGTQPDEMAQFVIELVENKSVRKNAWDSIKNYTIENMARNFIEGITKILNQ